MSRSGLCELGRDLVGGNAAASSPARTQLEGALDDEAREAVAGVTFVRAGLDRRYTERIQTTMLTRSVPALPIVFVALLVACGSSTKGEVEPDALEPPWPPIVEGRFLVQSASATNLVAMMQIRTNRGTDGMGGATIVTAFDPAVLSFPAAPARDVDYAFHACSAPPYHPATVTRPLNGAVWVNLDLPLEAAEQGQVITGPEAWTDLVTLTFGVVDAAAAASIQWDPDSMFWGIYDDDNMTLWVPGTFENLSGAALGR